MKRIGFACKWIDDPSQVKGIKPTDDCKQYNTGATTISWLNRQTKEVAEQKLWDLMVQNLTATQKLVNKVGELNENLRMVRLSSDILPAYTEPTWSYFWRKPDVVEYLERNFDLFILRVTRQPNDLHAIQQRSGDIQTVGRGDKHDFGQVVVHFQVMIVEGVVLLRIQHFEQRRGRIAMEAARAELVDFVEDEHRVPRLRASEPLHDLPWERADVGATVAADFRFVAHKSAKAACARA